MLDQIAERVAARLNAASLGEHLRAEITATIRETVHAVVSETSERLVRDEIARIKAQAERETHLTPSDRLRLSFPRDNGGYAVPEKPALEGLEDTLAARWEREGTYRFDRARSRDQIIRSTRRRRR